MKIEDTLKERGERYGAFVDHAAIAQSLQDVMRAGSGWEKLAPDQKQALTVIADKIARMLNGAADYRDNWHDIVGYATLVDNRMLLDAMVAEQELQAVLDPFAGQWGTDVPAGYIAWSGDRNPCDENTRVSVLFRDGQQLVGYAKDFVWHHINIVLNTDIIGYRTI